MPENEPNTPGPAADSQVTPSTATPSGVAGEQAPVVLVPVSADDFEGRKRRNVWALAITTVLVIASVVYIYKLKVDPIRARESYQSAERLYRIARYEQAILEFGHAVSLNPLMPDAYLLMGLSKRGLSRSQESIPDFTKVIELRPNDPEGYLERAAAYIDLEKFDLAIADCSQAIQIKSNLGRAYILRAVAERSLKQIDKALADMDLAIEYEPTMNHYFERAATLQSVGQHERAMADLNKVIDFAPLNAQAYHARALSFRALGDEKSANRDHNYGRYLDGR